MAELVNGYDVDMLARSLFDARSVIRGVPCTDTEWQRHAEQFPSTHRMLLAEARRIALEGEDE